MYGEALTHVAGREEEVEFYYKEVLMRQPAHVRCMTNYGLLISRDAARHAEAERIYEFAIARTQSKDFNDLPYVPAHIMTNLANLYIKMGDLGRAETMYNRALGVLPTHPQAGCNLAIVLVHLRPCTRVHCMPTSTHPHRLSSLAPPAHALLRHPQRG